MIQRSPKILPKCSVCAWVVRREQQRHHIDQTKHAGRTNQDPKHKSESNRKFPIRYQERTKLRMRQHKVSQQGGHERIRTLGEETVDPQLKAASASELRAEYFVFGEDQEKHANSYPQSSKRAHSDQRTSYGYCVRRVSICHQPPGKHQRFSK